MDVTLYTTHCAKCKILEKKLDEAGIEYNVVDDVDFMLTKGFKAAPMLEVNGQEMTFGEAVKWVNNQ